MNTWRFDVISRFWYEIFTCLVKVPYLKDVIDTCRFDSIRIWSRHISIEGQIFRDSLLNFHRRIYRLVFNFFTFKSHLMWPPFMGHWTRSMFEIYREMDFYKIFGTLRFFSINRLECIREFNCAYETSFLLVKHSE